MATMYSLFFGVLFTVVCSGKGNGSGVLRPDVVTPSYVMSTVVETSKDFIETGFNNSLFSRKPQLSFSMTRTYFFSAKKYAKTGTKWSSAKLNSSLKPRSAVRSKTFDTKEVHPLAIVKNLPPVSSQARFVGDKLRECMVFASNCLLSTLMSPVKQLAIKDDLLAYGVKGRKATNRNSVHFALGQDSQSKRGIGGQETLGTACVALRSLDEHRVNSLDLCFFPSRERRSQSGDEDNNKIRNNKTLLAESRQSIIAIASKELGIREATGNNDGLRVEEYLRYTNLSKGYEWCAAFVSWCYGQAGFAVPRNPWSPALFSKVKLIRKDQCQPADVFGIYGVKAKRINHVGLVKELSKDYLITIEGNSNNWVESRRRHLRTVYAVADWVN
ncbi:hypothetical protein SAMN05660841_01693 [Sphingobacterium nematocida]|uniref:CHAP domain-containing protein n=1 Tax=Sphingobacterium nematocida TaxID=1513896 RepID=A0A1T5D056_9SPHI|nr:hypothetical protein [Sphingobacterium nematocida]SKB65007.1 hypothetical protein SAMN05660841_01693 [Sphingobacterium nematocida]